MAALRISMVAILLALIACGTTPHCGPRLANWDAPLPGSDAVSFAKAHVLGTPGNFLPRLGTPKTIFLARDPPRGRMLLFVYDLPVYGRVLVYEERASMTPSQFHAYVQDSVHDSRSVRTLRVRGGLEAIGLPGGCGEGASIQWLDGRLSMLVRSRSMTLDQASAVVARI